MHRILPFVLVVAALGLHFTFCEWDVRSSPRGVAQSQHERTIYFHYRSHRSVYLLARPSSDSQEAKLWGVVLPGLMFGGAVVAWRLDPETAVAMAS